MAAPTPPATTQLDALASDPVTMGWMVGSPPPPDKLIRFGDASYSRFPRTRWSYSNMRQLMPTSVVPRANHQVAELPRAERTDLDGITFKPIARQDVMTWGESLLANYTDGILVLHRGRVVYERYFGVLTPHTQHIAFSVTKSFVATLAATLIHEGKIDETRSGHRVPAGVTTIGLCRRHDSARPRHDDWAAVHRGLRRRDLVDLAFQSRW